MQQGRDDALLVEPFLCGDIERVDPVQRMIGRVANQPLDRGDRVGVGRLTQDRKQGFGFAHAPTLLQSRRSGNPDEGHARGTP